MQRDVATNKVYPIRYRFLSLVLLVSTPLNNYLKNLKFCNTTFLSLVLLVSLL